MLMAMVAMAIKQVIMIRQVRVILMAMECVVMATVVTVLVMATATSW